MLDEASESSHSLLSYLINFEGFLLKLLLFESLEIYVLKSELLDIAGDYTTSLKFFSFIEELIIKVIDFYNDDRLPLLLL